MDLEKFLWLLDERALFLPRAHWLGDPFEASTPLPNIQDLRRLEETLQVSTEHIGTFSRHFTAMKRAFLPYYLVNCWCMNEFESAAMWRLYSSGNNSIALQARFDCLVSVLPENFGVGRVTYIDYMTERIPEGNVFHPIMYKRKSFEHESEVRAVTIDDKLDATTMQRLYESSEDEWKAHISSLSTGIAVPIDITRLIEAVWVSPGSAGWFAKIVRNLVERSGYGFPVKRSDLDRDPVY